MDKPLFSIVIPTFNRLEFLKKAISSSLQQTYAEIEIIILDNASTDGTQDYVQSLLATHQQINYIRNAQNIGLVANWQQITDHLRGDYFTVLSDDDFLYPEFCQTAVNDLAEYPQAALWYCRWNMIHKNGDFRGVSLEGKRFESGSDFIFNLLKYERQVLIAATAIRTSVFKRLGGFTGRRIFLDFVAIWTTAYPYAVVHSNKILSVFRHYNTSCTHSTPVKDWIAALAEVNHKLEAVLQEPWGRRIVFKCLLARHLLQAFYQYYPREGSGASSWQDKAYCFFTIVKSYHFHVIPAIIIQLIRNQKFRWLRIKHKFHQAPPLTIDDKNYAAQQMMAIVSYLVSQNMDFNVFGQAYLCLLAKRYFEFLSTLFSAQGLPTGNIILHDAIEPSTADAELAEELFQEYLQSEKAARVQQQRFYQRAVRLRRKYQKLLQKRFA